MTTTLSSSSSSNATVQRWLALAVGVLIVLSGGLLYGKYSQRWGPPPDLVAAAKQLETFPTQIGPWKMVEELPVDKSALEMLECAGHVSRRYMNQDNGKSVNITLLVGPPGPTAVHTPEICFSSRAYEVQSDRKPVTLAASSATDQHSFWNVDFSSRNALAEGLRVYYAWSRGRSWEASESPRYEFAAAPMLYKIQLAAPVASRLESNQSDPVKEFLEALTTSGWSLAPKS